MERDLFPAKLAATKAAPRQTIAIAIAKISAVLDSLALAGGGFMALYRIGDIMGTAPFCSGRQGVGRRRAIHVGSALFARGVGKVSW